MVIFLKINSGEIFFLPLFFFYLYTNILSVISIFVVEK